MVIRSLKKGTKVDVYDRHNFEEIKARISGAPVLGGPKGREKGIFFPFIREDGSEGLMKWDGNGPTAGWDTI